MHERLTGFPGSADTYWQLEMFELQAECLVNVSSQRVVRLLGGVGVFRCVLVLFHGHIVILLQIKEKKKHIVFEHLVFLYVADSWLVPGLR